MVPSLADMGGQPQPLSGLHSTLRDLFVCSKQRSQRDTLRSKSPSLLSSRISTSNRPETPSTSIRALGCFPNISSNPKPRQSILPNAALTYHQVIPLTKIKFPPCSRSGEREAFDVVRGQAWKTEASSVVLCEMNLSFVTDLVFASLARRCGKDFELLLEVSRLDPDDRAVQTDLIDSLPVRSCRAVMNNPDISSRSRNAVTNLRRKENGVESRMNKNLHNTHPFTIRNITYFFPLPLAFKLFNGSAPLPAIILPFPLFLLNSLALRILFALSLRIPTCPTSFFSTAAPPLGSK